MKKSVDQVLRMIQEGRVFELTPEHFDGRYMTIEEMKAIFDSFGAFWEYDGEPDPNKPHAVLKSGKHSNGFIPCKLVLKYPTMAKLFASEVVKKIDLDAPEIDVVVSSAYSAINLGYEVARTIADSYNPRVEYVEIEKDSEGNPTILRDEIDPNKKVLVVNELMTTKTGSTWESRKAVLTRNIGRPPGLLPYSVVLVHRSKDNKLPDETDVIPIFHFNIEDWDVNNGETCKYCEAGSPAIKPKIGNNWALLHGKTVN